MQSDINTIFTGLALVISLISLFLSLRVHSFSKQAKLSEKKTELLNVYNAISQVQNEGSYILMEQLQLAIEKKQTESMKSVIKRMKKDDEWTSRFSNLELIVGPKMDNCSIIEIEEHIVMANKSLQAQKNYLRGLEDVRKKLQKI